MSANAFLDTNVLVYAIEPADAGNPKSTVAAALVNSGDFAISTQVLGEFYRVVTGKRRAAPMAHDLAASWVEHWKSFAVQPISLGEVDAAVRLVGRYRIGYFDALILAAARSAGCTVVYSEDLNDGQDYDGVTIRNPFASATR